MAGRAQRDIPSLRCLGCSATSCQHVKTPRLWSKNAYPFFFIPNKLDQRAGQGLIPRILHRTELANILMKRPYSYSVFPGITKEACYTTYCLVMFSWQSPNLGLDYTYCICPLLQMRVTWKNRFLECLDLEVVVVPQTRKCLSSKLNLDTATPTQLLEDRVIGVN